MTRIVLATTAESLRALVPAFTVEAEYGSSVVCGSRGTLAHHEAAIAAGLDSGCPCLLSPADELWGQAISETDFCGSPSPSPNAPASTPVIGVSHWDWDTAGGVFALLGVKPTHGLWREVWQSIAYSDVHGPHRAEEFGSYAEVHPIVEAMRAYASTHRIAAPRGATVVDITEGVESYRTLLAALDQEIESAVASDLERERLGTYLESGLPLLEAGLRFRIDQQNLEAGSYVASFAGGRILLRASDRFVNHLYHHEGRVAPCVIGFNTALGRVTLSFEHPDALGKLSASELMRAHFGEGAGGHRGIAGSPREGVYSLGEAEALARFVEGRVKGSSLAPM